jgi:hypothetical protein
VLAAGGVTVELGEVFVLGREVTAPSTEATVVVAGFGAGFGAGRRVPG